MRSDLRPSADSQSLSAELLELGAATLGETGGTPMRARVHAVWPGARLAATAWPVRCTPGDNLAIHVAVVRAPVGSALVVDVGSEHEWGYWGEVLTTAAQARGIAGLVIDGGVRDSAALESHGFPVFATMVALRGASKNASGTVGAPVRAGGVEVAAGDWIVADADGVTVVASGAVEEILAAGRARAGKEARLFEELRSGRSTLELLDLDPSPVRQA